jgi:hypothetical protein
MTKPFTDNVFQPVKLYVEGVQTPFVSITVSSGIGGLPTASVTIPPQAALMDIARFYSPKIHIFYTDIINDYDDPKEADKLLFSGVIAQVYYNKRKDVASGLGITFNCVHRYNFMNDMLIDYTGWLNGDPINPAQAEGIKADTANSTATVMEALTGVQDPKSEIGVEITPDTPEGKTSILPEKYKKYYNRVLGMPGVLFNFWNQMKRSAFNRQLRQGNLYYSEAFVKMYQPLTEDGLQFFSRLGGHYPIEAMVQADTHRVDPCPDTPGKKDKIVIPPARQLFLSSSVQAEMTVANIASYLQNSGEVTTIYQIFNNFYDSIDYEIVTLASPAEVAIRADTVLTAEERAEFVERGGDTQSNETHALDTIVKPKLPFYFSPTCNVLFPGMYSNVTVQYDEIGMPTRINLKNLEGVDERGYKTNFRAPHSVREAIAKKVAGVNGVGGYSKDNIKYSLISTTGQSYGAIGMYEQGRGIKQETMHMPRWLSHFSSSTLGGHAPVKDQAPDKTNEQAKYEALNQLSTGWAKRYPGDQMKTLNPYAPQDTDISAHHRMLFSASDYYYTQRFASSKAGSVECPFNPHLTPGYPMDILEANPAYPSFHAMCVQVTHTFTESSMFTTAQFVGAMTYAEMANYHIPFVSPMLQVALGLAENPTLVEPDEKALKTASDFYANTLGVPAVSPNELIDFRTMLVKPKKWSTGSDSWTDGSGTPIPDVSNGGERNPMLSYYGNLSLTYRPIEAKSDVERRFFLTFIDMEEGNYSPTMIKYRDQQLDSESKYELGRSQFLNYDTFFGEQVIRENTQRTNNPSAAVVETTDSTGNKTANRIGQ